MSHPAPTNGPDNRERILDRLFTVLSGITLLNTPTPAFETFARNRGLLDQEHRPAVVLLDGDETGLVLSNVPRGRPGMKSAMFITMRPQIFILLKSKGPQNEGVGPLLNQYRTAVLKAIATDATLITLIGANGDIQYDGAETDLKSGSNMSGEMQINLSIRTSLNPLAT
jgi:hypothetical protein